WLKTAVEWVLIVGSALLAAFLIKTFLLQAFYIPSPSMEPTLNVQDRILVNKLSYRLHDVKRGDIVVFERPPTEFGAVRDLVKRVIALPGETVEGRDGVIFIDGEALPEPYLPAGTTTSAFGPEVIPAGHYWMLGDNRGNSSDSRVFKSVDKSRFIGRAFVRVWPLGDFGLL
ncbi:MAG: signal peptidase I, partial [Acidimicrobiales bacterium]